MNSWIYVFSQFTPEALLFEALLICVLFCGYTAFWILRKRRYGPVESELPAGPVKTYLNELIGNAEYLRTQLFGLLSGGEIPKSFTPPASVINTSDPEIAKKMSALEAKMNEQAEALSKITAEKSQLEKALAEVKANPAPATTDGAGGGNSADLSALQQKIQELENKLAEYNVIEDDLANLKRLQQENVQLKAQLTGKGDPAPQSAASPPPAASVAAPPVAVAAVPAAEPAPAPPSTEQFENLANQVQESLPPNVAEIPSASSGAPVAEAPPVVDGSAPLNEAVQPEKKNDTEADLVAEFEKMLKG